LCSCSLAERSASTIRTSAGSTGIATENQRVYSVFVLVLTYLLPLGVLSLTYAAIGRQLWNRTIPGNADLARDSQHIRAKRKIVKMLIVVVTLFALCWMPLHVFNVLSDYTELNTWLPGVTLDRIFIVSHWTAMANSFVNPMVYGFMNDTFKADLRDLAQRLRCCRSGRQLQVPVTNRCQPNGGCSGHQRQKS
uniref:G_PROTEIN_RECEP_F1_2 domain-containing protein n=1 Tax=Macrostomum lignano TaxID=282301 RepID=A0A1I8HWB1_9PLAT